MYVKMLLNHVISFEGAYFVDIHFCKANFNHFAIINYFDKDLYLFRLLISGQINILS